MHRVHDDFNIKKEIRNMLQEKGAIPECPGAALGLPMVITFDGIGTFKGVLVGMEPGHCLIMKLPPMPDLPLKLYQKNYFVVRYFHAGSAFGFRTTLIGIIKEPLKLYILDYPAVIETLNLRKNERYDCLIPTQASIQAAGSDPWECSGFITDISSGGCCFECITSTDMKVGNIKIGDIIKLSFTLLNNDSPKTLQAVARTLKIDHRNLSVGLKYRLDPDNDAQLVAFGAVQTFIESLRD
jgi:hypothetical protein